MDLPDDYLDLYKADEGSGRIFTLLFNSSNLISPAYAAAIVLGISFGIAALAGLLYYALIGGFDSEGSYGGYSQYSNYLNKLGFRRRRSTFDDDLSLVSILKSLNSTELIMNQDGNDIESDVTLSSANLCKIKLKICQISQNSRSFDLPRNHRSRHKNMKILTRVFMDIRTMRDNQIYRNDPEHTTAGTNQKQKLEILEDILKVEKQLQKLDNCENFIKRQGCSKFLYNNEP